jgi:hypothetical protein
MIPAVGYVVEGAAYLGGTLLVAGGLYLVIRGVLPGWWQRRFMWPLVRATRGVARFQGLAAIALGTSLIALVFTTWAGESLAGVLVIAGLAAYVVAVGLYVLSAWLSRRPV